MAAEEYRPDDEPRWSGGEGAEDNGPLKTLREEYKKEDIYG